jgi:hypothetical protein
MWEFDAEKPGSRIEVVFVLIDHAKEAIPFRLRVFETFIDLPQLERLFIALVADADYISLSRSHGPSKVTLDLQAAFSDTVRFVPVYLRLDQPTTHEPNRSEPFHLPPIASAEFTD